MIYLANPCSPDVRLAMRAGLLGMIDTPAQGNVLEDADWCADNGCFGSGYPGDEAWLEWLRSHPGDRASCLFATAPDVVGDFAATAERSRPFLPLIREAGYAAALVAQDGMEYTTWDCWDEIDALFIGGSTAWKLSDEVRNLAAVASSLGKWVHMGRVNSRKRLMYADAIGCDSADGTYLTFGPDKNLPTLLGWLAEMNSQGSLQLAFA